MRNIRSRHARNYLYVKADGKCGICGEELGEDWQPDHIIPYTICKETEFLNLQPVCKICNLKKGTNMLREHQRKFITVMDDKIRSYNLGSRCCGFVSGKKPPSVWCNVFPGGGKSVLPIIATKKLIDAGIIDRVCWVVPRTSLKVQGAQEFAKNYLKSLFPHNLEIREVETVSDTNPTRGSVGYVTTYQSLLQAKKLTLGQTNINEYEFKKHKYLLVLDEFHHLFDDGEAEGFLEAIQPLYDLSKFVIGMTGTAIRHDKKRVAFIDYEEVNKDGEIFYEPKFDVIYEYKYALKEKAIIPLYTDNANTLAVSYTVKRGSKAEEIKKTSIENGRDLHVALDTEIGDAILKAGFLHWQQWKLFNPRAKLIIIGNDQKHCRTIANKLFEFDPRLGTCLAISDDGKEAYESIKNFRSKPHCNALVTCQMAYEGLDCKQATHIIVLTRIRSIPWLIQAITRVMRYDIDGISYEEQRAFAFIPDDEMMRKAIKAVGGQIDTMILEKEDDELRSLLKSLSSMANGEIEFSTIENKYSAVSGFSQSDLNGQELTADLRTKVSMFKSKNNLSEHLTEIELFNILKAANSLAVLGEFGSVNEEILKESKQSDDSSLTIREKEDLWRKKIQSTASYLDKRFGYDNGAWNKKIFNANRWKNRKDMDIKELTKCYEWLINEAKLEAKKLLEESSI
jgi:superfamily II DNA or RNA helicase